MKERDITFDIMKAIGIILMVIGHAGCPKVFLNFLGTFHMPLFFMISGWFINAQYPPHLLKKVKTLYWPYIFWGITILVIQYPLYKLGIYSKEYSQYDYITHLIKIVSFAQNEPIIGPLWFLKSLFFSYIFVSTIVWKTIQNKKKYYFTGLLCFIMLYFGYILYKKNGWLLYNIQRELMIPWLLWLGYYIKTLKINLLSPSIIIFIYFIILFCCGQYVTLDLVGSKIGNPAILTIYSLIGFVMVYNISFKLQHISKQISKSLAYIGRNTMPILILHLICIKFIQIIMSVYNIDVNLSSVLIFSDPYWPIYSIIGISMPLYLNHLYLKIKK